MISRLRSASLLCALVFSSVTSVLSAQDVVAPKKSYFWFGMWPDLIAQFDPATDTVVRKVKLRNGLQWGRTLSFDKTRFFVVTDQKKTVEVVDLARGEVVDEHNFDEAGWIVRVSRVRELPGGTHWYVHVDRVERKPDHFIVKRPQILFYDHVNKKVDKRLDKLPKILRSGARISPDGTKWHVFDGDLKIVDPKTLKEEAVVALKTPRHSGWGAIETWGRDFYDGKNPAAYKMMFRMRDPLNRRRRVFGMIEIDMEKHEVASLVEWGAAPDFWNFQVSHDKKVAVGMGRGRGDQSRIAMFDMTNGKKLTEVYHKFRPRRRLNAISPDGSKIYVGGAGNDFAIYGRDLELVKTVELEADLLGSVTIVEE